MTAVGFLFSIPIRRLNVLRFYRLSAVVMALTVALTACTEGTDGTGLNDEPFAPDASAADLQVVQGAFAASVFESLAISSESFTLVVDTGAVSVGPLQASLAAASAGSHWEAEADPVRLTCSGTSCRLGGRQDRRRCGHHSGGDSGFDGRASMHELQADRRDQSDPVDHSQP